MMNPTLALGLSNTNTALVGAGCVVAGIGGTLAVQSWRRKKAKDENKSEAQTAKGESNESTEQAEPKAEPKAKAKAAA